ncbi:MAG: hypothetical protein ACK500_10395 [Flavobacteriales bacterium]
MKKLIGIFVILSAGFCATAQSGTVNGTVLLDSPEEANFYRFRIPLWCATLSGHNTSVYDLALGIDIKPNDKFIINADYRIGLADRVFPENSLNRNGPKAYATGATVFPQNKALPARNIDVAVTYFFITKSKSKNLRFKLKQVGNVEYVTYVPGTEIEQWGIRGGFLAGSTWYGMNDVTVEYGESLDFLNGDNMFEQSTNLRYSQLRVGVGFSQTSNLWVNFDDYGVRGNVGTVLYYADLLVGMRSDLDDVYYAERGVDEANTYFYTPGAIDESVKSARLGFEIGLRQLPCRGAFSGYAALGRINGIQGGSNGYFRMGAQISLGTRTKEPKV